MRSNEFVFGSSAFLAPVRRITQLIETIIISAILLLKPFQSLLKHSGSAFWFLEGPLPTLTSKAIFFMLQKALCLPCAVLGILRVGFLCSRGHLWTFTRKAILVRPRALFGAGFSLIGVLGLGCAAPRGPYLNLNSEPIL